VNIKGGNAPIYLSNNIVRFDDKEKLKNDAGFYINGSIVTLGLVKSRTNRAGAAAMLVFNQDEGFDDILSLYLLLKTNGRVNGGGSSFYIGDRDDIKFAQKNFKEKYNTNPELKAVFIQEAVTILKNSLTIDLEQRSNISMLSTNVMDIINADLAA